MSEEPYTFTAVLCTMIFSHSNTIGLYTELRLDVGLNYQMQMSSSLILAG